mgnify:CR=1 FL=1
MIKRKGWIVVGVLLLLAIGLFIFKNIILIGLGNYLTINQPTSIPKSDVLIVLGSDVRGERTKKAAELYQQGYADKLLLSDGGNASWRLRTVDEMAALAIKLGVPKEDIIIEGNALGTYENAIYTKEIIEKTSIESAIVVSTTWHMRRVKFTFEQVFADSKIKLTYVGTEDDRFNEQTKWWKESERQQVILTEWSKLIVYWFKY